MDPLLAIGVFSRLSAISVRMLRHYQGFGILEPARVDPFTGHRFYRPEQLVTAHWVVRLRDAGLPVSEIGRVLAATDDPGLLQRLLSEHHARLDADRLTLERREEAFRHLTTYLEAATMTIDVRIETLPALTVAALRRVLPDYGSEGLLWQEIGALMAADGAAIPEHDAGIGGATFWDPDHRESDVDVEVWLQVAQPFTATAPLTCQEVPPRQVVLATLRGSYDGMGDVTAALGSFLAAHRLEPGPMFNIYRVSPVQNPDPASWVTDVCFPIRTGD